VGPEADGQSDCSLLIRLRSARLSLQEPALKLLLQDAHLLVILGSVHQSAPTLGVVRLERLELLRQLAYAVVRGLDIGHVTTVPRGLSDETEQALPEGESGGWDVFLTSRAGPVSQEVSISDSRGLRPTSFGNPFHKARPRMPAIRSGWVRRSNNAPSGRRKPSDRLLCYVQHFVASS